MPKRQRKDTQDKLDELLDFIRAWQETHRGASPSRREMMIGVGASSPSVINYRIDRMTEAGMILPNAKYTPRTISLPGLKEVYIFICPADGCGRSDEVPAICPDHHIEMISYHMREV